MCCTGVVEGVLWYFPFEDDRETTPVDPRNMSRMMMSSSRPSPDKQGAAGGTQLPGAGRAVGGATQRPGVVTQFCASRMLHTQAHAGAGAAAGAAAGVFAVASDPSTASECLLQHGRAYQTLLAPEPLWGQLYCSRNQSHHGIFLGFCFASGWRFCCAFGLKDCSWNVNVVLRHSAAKCDLAMLG